MAGELPPEDVMDQSGRMKRLVIAFVLGVMAASIAWFVTNELVKPELVNGAYQRRGAGKFIFYFTALAGAGVFTIALVIQNSLAKKRWRESRGVAAARTVSK